MSKTKDTSKFDHAKLENRVLADSELDAVIGGTLVGATATVGTAFDANSARPELKQVIKQTNAHVGFYA
jgi:hypothetical protein